ncbi:uncharacterized protein MONBRDRAFT_38660 [Monosiga brevicollis MX1]|uniref:COP9 signalosome complex subunit 4 n=1 Tax=Monosiga brevicollis TaxID=81824 RepID=A9V999_MONBE|nr:uncharacterized protein MONBRDRAFT_38660 [Monosiga brevicollis MX1]EDQ85892.1 predicted protein [Monosiga brevicollis MX1]|eukprot:XP_001749371.1 hypothetical protein [Monosiga brevicollis MX1]
MASSGQDALRDEAVRLSAAPASNVGALTSLTSKLLDESTLLMPAKQALDAMINGLRSSVQAHRDIPEVEKVLAHYLQASETRSVAFEDVTCRAREVLADILESREAWVDAARVLAAIPLESSHRHVETEYKFHIYLRIGALYLEEEDAGMAETYVSRASMIAHEVNNTELQFKFKVQAARVNDAKRKYLQASQRYLDLSYTIPDEEARQAALSQAVTCAVLAPAGPRRSRLLATLFKDERTHALPQFHTLEAMHLQRIVRSEDLAKFAAGLAEHHKARTADGSTVLEKAVVEHNMLSATRVYDNITLEELGRLVNVSTEQAEHTVAQMIADGRLSGQINQLEGRVTFADAEHLVQDWDAAIAALCAHVNGLVEEIGHNHADWLAARAVATS